MKGVSMAFYKYKGKRIRASDKNLVYRFCVGTLLLLFVAVFPRMYKGERLRTALGKICLLGKGGRPFP